ncbi:MFS transporter [Haematomicrobium sanguinis]|uniref:MFS transporter n=1 Tax=Haematomicrobium sanguinis TaxID=479106 RepID=UPI000AA7614F|nr:MFS transporter [Haematomicrobium sanguinis]
MKTLLGTGIGNAVEWYDWAVYSTFVSYFSVQLFNPDDPTSAFLAALAVFAVGFIARPFGGFVFGWIGDRIGRKAALTLAIAVASVGSLVIGLVPTYESIGAWASLILLLARLAQGLAHGGELPSAQTYLAEMAPRERRGLWSSFIYFSGTIGIVFGMLLGAIMSSILPKDAMMAYGWRIPFILGAVFGLYGLVMRARLHETETFSTAKEDVAKERLWAQIFAHRKQAFQVIGLVVGLTVIYYVWSISAAAYATSVLKFEASVALWAGVVSNLVFMAMLPFWGRLSDRIGRKPVLLIGALVPAVLTAPMTLLIKDSPWQLFVAMSAMLMFISAFSAVAPAVFAEIFPTGIRTVGLGVPYSIAVALFGGTAPYLQGWFASINMTWMFTVYSIVLLLVSASVIFTLPETKAKDLSTVGK